MNDDGMWVNGVVPDSGCCGCAGCVNRIAMLWILLPVLGACIAFSQWLFTTTQGRIVLAAGVVLIILLGVAASRGQQKPPPAG